MAKTSPRTIHLQVPQFIRFRVNYNDTNVATGEYIGTIPAGAIIIGTTTSVSTAFNAGTTNSLTVGGNSPSYNDVATAAQTLCGSTGPSSTTQNVLPSGSSLASITADRDLFATYQQTGTAASAGVADIMVMYIGNTDK